MSSNPYKGGKYASSQAKQFSKKKKDGQQASQPSAPVPVTPHTLAYQGLYQGKPPQLVLSSLQTQTPSTKKKHGGAKAQQVAAAAKAQAAQQVAAAAKAQAAQQAAAQAQAAQQAAAQAQAAQQVADADKAQQVAEQQALLNYFNKLKKDKNNAAAQAHAQQAQAQQATAAQAQALQAAAAKAQAAAQAQALQAAAAKVQDLQAAAAKAQGAAQTQALQAAAYAKQIEEQQQLLNYFEKLKNDQNKAKAAQAATQVQALQVAAHAATQGQTRKVVFAKSNTRPGIKAAAQSPKIANSPELTAATLEFTEATQALKQAEAEAQAAINNEAHTIASYKSKPKTADQEQTLKFLKSRKDEAVANIDIASAKLKQAESKLAIHQALVAAPKTHGMKPIIIEQQESLKCGQHTLNNLLQNDKLKFITDFKNQGTIMPKPGCINLAYFCDKFMHLGVGPHDLCDFKTGYYDITILNEALKMLNMHVDLNFDMSLISPAKKAEFTKIIRNPKLIGFIVNKPGHWYAVIKQLPQNVIDVEGINGTDKVIVIDSQYTNYIPLDIPGLIAYLHDTVALYVVTLP